MHRCANVVCGDEGVARAVLIRALAPLEGLAAMRERRGRLIGDAELCSGPAKLCQALGLELADDGADLVSGEAGPFLADDGTPPPRHPWCGRRVGLSGRVGEAALYPWRFAVGDGPRHPRRGVD